MKVGEDFLHRALIWSTELFVDSSALRFPVEGLVRRSKYILHGALLGSRCANFRAN